MTFGNESHQAMSFFTSHPEPFHIFWFVLIFVANFVIARYLTIKLVMGGYVQKNPIALSVDKKGKLRSVVLTNQLTEDYRKLFLFWFVPIFGVFGLLSLYITCTTAKTLIAIKQKLFLNHI
jgi:hypothetical protein